MSCAIRPVPRQREQARVDRDGQDTLLHPRPAAATARRAKLGLGPRPRAGAVAVVARDDACVPHGPLAAEDGLLERHFEKLLQVALVASADPKDAEQVAENPANGDLADVYPPTRKRAACRERRARFFGTMAETVVH